MNFFLSMLVCLAVLLSGGELPAEPEAATAWTLRSAAVTIDGETFALAPEAHFTTAVGAERAALAFDVTNGGETCLPLAAELTEDALRFSFGARERAYALSAEDVAQVLNLSDPSVAPTLDGIAAYLRAACALLARQAADPAFAQNYCEAMWQALFDTCRTGVEPAEVEVDGEALPAERSQLVMNAETRRALADALLNSDLPELEHMQEAAQAMQALTSGAEGTGIPEMRITLTTAAREGLEYTLVEAAAEAAEKSMLVREEVVARGEATDAEVDMQLHLPGGESGGAVSLMLALESSITGPATAPEAAHAAMEALFAAASAPAEGDTSYSISNNALRMELDAQRAGGPGSGALRIETESSLSWAADEDARPESIYGDNTAFDLRWDGRAEDDGSDTWAVALAVDGEDALTFELNRAEGAAVPSLADRTELAFDLEALNGITGEDTSLLTSALGADVSQLMLDASLLAQDPGLAGLIGRLTQEIESYGDYDYDGSDYETTIVGTPAEAAAIFDGEVPDYRPPEGWALAQIEAGPAYLYLYYDEAATGREFDISITREGENSQLYAYRDGALVSPDETMVEVQIDGENSYIDVWTADSRSYFFYGDFTEADVPALLAGLPQ